MDIKRESLKGPAKVFLIMGVCTSLFGVFLVFNQDYLVFLFDAPYVLFFSCFAVSYILFAVFIIKGKNTLLPGCIFAIIGLLSLAALAVYFIILRDPENASYFALSAIALIVGIIGIILLLIQTRKNEDAKNDTFLIVASVLIGITPLTKGIFLSGGSGWYVFGLLGMIGISLLTLSFREAKERTASVETAFNLGTIETESQPEGDSTLDSSVPRSAAMAYTNNVSPESTKPTYQNSSSAPSVNNAAKATTMTSSEMIETLKKYKQLLDMEIITQEEYDLKKQSLLAMWQNKN